MTMSDEPKNFLNLPPEHTGRASRYAVLPVPYEGTVSYLPGTAEGPAAILSASAQVEYFDEELGGEFIEAGVMTCPMLEPASGPEEQMRRPWAASTASARRWWNCRPSATARSACSRSTPTRTFGTSTAAAGFRTPA